ncbi:DUF421 domain-containing protein [Cytobacillus depressus]|uniref:DUF421 domain-containing protein n=1 Tax=Cytobacillus depressus TaxID=1602942 RepID=A0A6L3V491_9BACI|nr:DUF421 domain-containing protein [Cytobacillus depressus]KAB2334820.1 DUF421 domain-containing protein [Cytobacillus depressus]
MDFFQSHESLTTVEWILRAVVAYIFMLVILKLLGRRSLAQLSLFDFALALMIGNIIAHPLSDERLGFKGSMTTMIVIAILYLLCVFLTLKSFNVRKMFLPEPLPLVKNGEIKIKNLAKSRISVEYLLSAARKEKIEDLKKVSLALWEPDGTISFFIRPDLEPVTRSDMNIVPEAFSFPITVIREGNIDSNQLKKLGVEKSWLQSNIKKAYHADINQVLLATLDKNKQLKVFLYRLK